MSLNQIVLASAEAEHTNVPYFVGGGTLVLFLFAMAVLLMFAAGREHS